MSQRGVLSGEFFMMGDIACAEGSISAGCRFFAGYPITPATEVAERMSYRMPQVGGTYIQMEDELGSMAAVLGGSWGGVKAMTATSGPGFSLMMENLGLGIMTETPCVLVNVQRAGPSTGLPTLAAQGDMMQARWGTHGPYEIIALAPSSPQELFDLTIRAFNLSEKYRLPVLVMTDAEVGHMTEKVVIPPPEEIELYPRRLVTVPPEEYLPFKADEDLVPPMANFGQGYRFHATGLTHDERGYPATADDSAQWPLIQRLIDKIQVNKHDIIQLEEEHHPTGGGRPGGCRGGGLLLRDLGAHSHVAYGIGSEGRDQGRDATAGYRLALPGGKGERVGWESESFRGARIELGPDFFRSGALCGWPGRGYPGTAPRG
jgi:2-oxoglutarate ferredoxin oxidoreductase subunit alpha